MTAQTLLGISTVPAIVGVVQVLKDLGLPSRAAPAAAVVLGVLAQLAQTYYTRYSWIPAIAAGLALGLSAAGLYAGGKATFSRSTTAPNDQSTTVPTRHAASAPPVRIGGSKVKLSTTPLPDVPWDDERTTTT